MPNPAADQPNHNLQPLDDQILDSTIAELQDLRSAIENHKTNEIKALRVLWEENKELREELKTITVRLALLESLYGVEEEGEDQEEGDGDEGAEAVRECMREGTG
ncbi:hypothetical protein BD309DRAFT_950646 [Dichomitus squalens]|nr:hypothetical protein BD309DRAFT_950646 [Dichomitus squalens]